MKKYLSFILLLVAVNTIAQQITATAGGNVTGNSGSVSYTIGQQDYISYSSIAGSVNEGVQQPVESFCSFLSGNIVAPSGIRQFTKLVPTVMIHTNITNPQQFTGHYTLQLSNNNNVLLTAYKNDDINKANGVTTLDIALIQSHILQKSILNSPYKILASDVNGDGKVSTLDIVYIKRLILGLDTTFTKTSINEKRLWAFVDSSYQFPDTTNPFPFKDSISYYQLNTSKTNQSFIGCKLGDVNWDWNPAVAKPQINNTNAVELSYSYPSDALAGRTDGVQSSDEVRIPVRVKNFKELLGLQYTINFNAAALKFVGINNKALNFETGTNHAAEGKVSLLWVDAKSEVVTLEDGSVLFELVFERTGKEAIGKEAIENALSMDGSVTAIAAYDKDYGVHDVVMKRGENIQPLQKENWVVAPNPTKDGVIQVQMNLKDNKNVVFRLLDNTGKVLLTKQVEGVRGANHFTLREGNIASGTYYLQAVGVEGVKQLRIEN
ncbi:MAG: dockerin type I domain-containing protein [Bacteroidota bacterium]